LPAFDEKDAKLGGGGILEGKRGGLESGVTPLVAWP